MLIIPQEKFSKENHAILQFSACIYSKLLLETPAVKIHQYLSSQYCNRYLFDFWFVCKSPKPISQHHNLDEI